MYVCFLEDCDPFVVPSMVYSMRHSFISMYLMTYFLLRRYYAVAISGNGTGLIPGHCAAVGFFFLLLINSWCAVSNYHSWKLNFMLLSAQLSFISVWWTEVLQAVACIRFLKKKKKRLSSIVPSCFHPTAQIDSILTEKSFWMSAAGWCWQMDTVILFGCLGACRSTLC